MSVEHDRFAVEREYPHPPARVFAAWADPACKRRWFDLSDDPSVEYRGDFRIGGGERLRTAAAPHLAYASSYRDIVEPERIVYTYEVTVEDRLASVSVATVQLAATVGGTHLTYTELVAHLDGLDTTVARTAGVSAQLDRLTIVLQEEP